MAETDTEGGVKKLQSRITPTKHAYFIGKLLVEAVICRDLVDPKAAIIVDSKDRRVGFGISFVPKPELSNKSWGRTEEQRELGLIHAEEAAIDTALKRYVPGASVFEPFDRHILYVTGPPSLRGTRRCLANGLKEIVYGPLVPRQFNDVEWEETKALAKAYGIKLELCEENLAWVRDRVESISHLLR